MTSLPAPPVHEMTALQLRDAASSLMADICAAEDLHAMVFKPIVFESDGAFGAVDAAERWLTSIGFSVGAPQAHALTGLMFGAYEISKWRNLSAADRAALHGRMLTTRNGPATIQFSYSMPPEAVSAVKAGLIQRIASATAKACAMPEEA